MSNFPTGLDSYDISQPLGTQTLATGTHSARHREIEDALSKMEAKVGINSSAVTSSHDYKLSGVAAGDKAMSLTGAEAPTGKTFDGNSNTFQNLAITSLKTVLAQASKFLTFDATGAPIATKAVPTGEVVGTTDSQTQVQPRLQKPYIGDYSLAGHNHSNPTNGGQLGSDAFPDRSISGQKILNLPVLRQDLTTNAQKNNSVVLTGWGFALGDGTTRKTSKSITFGITFLQPPMVTISPIGFKNGSDPTSITDCSALGGDTGAEANTPTATGFSALMTNVDAAAFGGTTRLLFCWIAIGEYEGDAAALANDWQQYSAVQAIIRRRDQRYRFPGQSTTGKLS